VTQQLWDAERALRHLTRLDLTHPRLERMLDAALGGKNNFATDRDLIRQMITEVDSLAAIRSLHALPRYYQRVIAHLSLAGIDQIVIIGTGLPTGLPAGQQLHDVAHALNPATRVVYIETDPLILATARATIEPGSDLIRILDGDIRDPRFLLTDSVLTTFLNWREPVGVLLGCLHDLPGDEHLLLASRLRQLMAPGSRLAVMQITHDHHPATVEPIAPQLIDRLSPLPGIRTRDQLLPMFAGLDLLHPGIVSVSRWRPDATPPSYPEPPTTGMYGALARLT
jgi:hypothetical protein